MLAVGIRPDTVFLQLCHEIWGEVFLLLSFCPLWYRTRSFSMRCGYGLCMVGSAEMGRVMGDQVISMSYTEFQKQIQEQLAFQLPEGYRLEMHQVIKNNDLQLDSLVIISDEINISPNFYLQQYYDEYQKGEKVEVMVQDMLAMYEKTKQAMGSYSMDLSFETCRERIVYHLTSGEKNSRRLENVPSIPFLNMVISFHVLMLEEETGIGSIMIHESLQKEWNVSVKQLFQLAQENTVRLFPVKICELDQMMSDLAIRTGQYSGMEICPGISDEAPGYQELLVVSNQKGINGAAVLLYPGCLTKLAEQCGGDYYILPSSIHEVLVLPEAADIMESDLQRMVREVNEKCVQPDEILSDCIYRYSREKKKVEICGYGA